MADSVFTQNGAPVRQRRISDLLRLLYPAEGLTVVLLHLVVILAASWAVLGTSWADGLGAIPVIAVAGALVGLLLAKAEAPDLAAQLTAFWLGLILVVVHAIVTFPELGMSYGERFRELVILVQEWIRQTARGDHAESHQLFVVLMGMMAWLVSYMSAWTLYRRGWITASLVLPAVVIVISLAYSDGSGEAPLALFLVAAGTLVAAHFAYRRRREWRHRGMQAPSAIGSRMLGLAFNAVLVITILGWLIPVDVRPDLLQTSWNSVSRPIDHLQGQVSNWLGDLVGNGHHQSQSYASFDSSFDLGGPLHLTDNPILAYSGDGGTAPYLAARRLDYWDGHGWRSDAGSTFNSDEVDGQALSSRVTYNANQQVALSPEVEGGRVQTDATLRIITPVNDNLLFTRDTYLDSSEPTSVELGWQSYDSTSLPIASAEERADLPPDLRQLGDLLANARFSDRGTNIIPSDDDQATSVLTQRKDLQERGLEAGWVVDGGKATALIVTGQLPIYDDIESVQARSDLRVGSQYSVTGLASAASASELRQAGTDYPSYVPSRYLQLPTTTTPETRALARQWVDEAGATTPFDMAETIQNQVRNRITYTETPPNPPSDRDLVDYVLFDSQQGYCEYYASAMAVMLRTLNIPARVVTGFYPADYDSAQNQYIYRERNAHVWVEAFFPGFGWIPFEPTANRAPQTFGEDASPPPSPSAQPSLSDTETPTPTTAASQPADASQPEADEPTPTPTAPPAAATDDSANNGATTGWPWWLIAILAAVVVLLAIVAFLAVRWRRGLTGMSPVSALYARALRLGSWLRIRSDPTMTPTEYAEELGRSIPAARQSARTVARLYSVEQYAPPGEAGEHDAGRRAWLDLRRKAIRAVPGFLNPFGRRHRPGRMR